MTRLNPACSRSRIAPSGARGQHTKVRGGVGGVRTTPRVRGRRLAQLAAFNKAPPLSPCLSGAWRAGKSAAEAKAEYIGLAERILGAK